MSTVYLLNQYDGPTVEQFGRCVRLGALSSFWWVWWVSHILSEVLTLWGGVYAQAVEPRGSINVTDIRQAPSHDTLLVCLLSHLLVRIQTRLFVAFVCLNGWISPGVVELGVKQVWGCCQRGVEILRTTGVICMNPNVRYAWCEVFFSMVMKMQLFFYFSFHLTIFNDIF